MAGYTIGAFSFVRWDGPRPQFISQHVIPFTKPGQDGTSALLTGNYGNAFTVNLQAVYADEASARNAERSYINQIGLVQTLIYEGTNYTTVYSTNYLVQNISNTWSKRNAHLCGPTYNYVNGWAVGSQWVLIPKAV